MTNILILIVDDEPPILELVSEVVTDMGCTPLVATDGRRALELAREHHPSVIVTDLMMPHLNGVELIEALHDEGKPPIPTILMTAASAQAAHAARADAVLAKPFDLDDLEMLLRRFLARPAS